VVERLLRIRKGQFNLCRLRLRDRPAPPRMSRGPGRIERAIRALFDAHPDDASPGRPTAFE
jgi:hypothetical protein